MARHLRRLCPSEAAADRAECARLCEAAEGAQVTCDWLSRGHVTQCSPLIGRSTATSARASWPRQSPPPPPCPASPPAPCPPSPRPSPTRCRVWLHSVSTYLFCIYVSTYLPCIYVSTYLPCIYLSTISTYLPHQVQAPGPDPGLACGPGTGWNTSLDAGNLQRTGAAVLVPAHCSPHTSLPVCQVAAGLLLVSPPDGLPGYCPAPASSGAIVHVSIVHSDYTRPHQTRVLSTDTESTVQAA